MLIYKKDNVAIKLDLSTKRNSLLEYKKNHINDELQTQLDFDEKTYEKHVRLYKALIRKYDYFLDEYNTYIKSGNEITKVDVKLYDNTNAKNSLIEENLDIELNEQIIRKQNLMENINNLKEKIKFLAEKQKEEKLKEEKKHHFCKIIGLYKTKIKKNNNIFRKSASSKNHKKKITFDY